jgi:hypothetical protein
MNLTTPKPPTVKTDKTPDAAQLGLVATWSAEFGHVSIHDPVEGEWWDLQTKDAPAFTPKRRFPERSTGSTGGSGRSRRDRIWP